METDRERLLLCYQVNQQVVHGKFPVNRELAFELASLMAQVGLRDTLNTFATTNRLGNCSPRDQVTFVAISFNTLNAMCIQSNTSV